MRTLTAVLLLAITTTAFSQGTDAAIARFAELGIVHNNAPIDADNIGNIQSLRVSKEAASQLTDDDLRHLAAIPRLGHLTLGGAPNITPAGFVHLQGIENLWNLNFRGAGLTDEQVAALADLEGLRSLDLALNREITDAAMPSIGSIGGLETLTLDSTAVTDAGLGSLTSHPTLQRVSVLQTSVTDAGLEPLGTISGLRSLGLSGSAIRGSGFVHLAGLTRLEEISAQNLQLGDSSMELLTDVPSLQRLFVWDNDLTDAATAHLASLPNLRTLYLDNNDITDAGVAAFAGHESLTNLWLSGTKVTDAGLAALQGTALEQVMLHRTAVTDDGLLTLVAIPTMRNIQARDSDITEAGVEAALDVEGRNERLQIRR